MITNNELNATKLSATKKDYYQIWNELLELAKKISSRWDPTSTNESDPGIILLKVLTALGDKINYNIDVNTLEAFMPSAAQMESMRKLCDMMGYNIKYYQSATTKISFAYTGALEEFPNKGFLEIPMFTSITNLDNNINYVTIENKILSKEFPIQTINCIEGQVARCESDNNNIITFNQLDDNFRYYLPETQIAENGIFIYRIADGVKSERWQKVNNLNTQRYKSTVYKFGYDSKVNRPYVQFPEDIGQIIEDGLEIYYIRTSGVNGNIAPQVLESFDMPASWDGVNKDDFSITNGSAATNGTNIETITQAYNNYKKIIGTFDTLVTCRDYMNTIYNLMSETDTPLVSNIVVSDIRDDINRSITLCSFNDYGINYIDKSLEHEQLIQAIDDTTGHSISYKTYEKDINTFDIMFYPFKTVYGLNTEEEYKNSFKLESGIVRNTIENKLAPIKNIAHKIIYPKDNEIVCIKNYLLLDAKITTTSKVAKAEQDSIIKNIKTAIYKSFNARQLDFGVEIPFDSILECIENADIRIKNVALNDPTLYTKFELANGQEYDTASYISTTKTDGNIELKYEGRAAYNKLALRNILAGRVELFNYDKSFKYDLTENNYAYVYDLNKVEQAPYSTIYPITENTSIKKQIVKLIPECSFKIDNTQNNELTHDLQLKLNKNEVIKFRAPNFKTKITYPAYVNYFIKLNNLGTDQAAIPATFETLKDFMADKWNLLKNRFTFEDYKSLKNVIRDQSSFNRCLDKYGAVFKIDTNTVSIVSTFKVEDIQYYYYLPLNASTFIRWNKWMREQTYQVIGEYTPTAYNGLYRSLGYSAVRSPGYLVDANQIKYQLCQKWHPVNEDEALYYYFVQRTWVDKPGENPAYTTDGLGKNAIYTTIPKNTEYMLKQNEFLAINYIPATNENSENIDPDPINIIYPAGTIIRPNFELVDSASLAATDMSYSKIDGFNFPTKPDIKGMFSLAVKEQIEIRDFIEVKLQNPVTYLYWILNNETETINCISESPVDDDGNRHYTLQDGEYLFYTDSNKTALAYYGSGTELLLHNDVNFIVSNKEREVSAADILNKGLEVVPWVRYHFGPNAIDKNITIREYQYFTLVEGDILNRIHFTGNNDIEYIDSSWKSVESANFTTNGISGCTLPQILVASGTGENNITWQVQSAFNLDVSPFQGQAIKVNDKLTLVYQDGSSDVLVPRYNNDTVYGEVKDLWIKTSYPCRSFGNAIDVSNNNKIKDNEFKVKLFENKTIGSNTQTSAQTLVGDTKYTTDASVINLHNYSDFWTSVSFDNLTSDTKFINLYANIPDNCFGLIMINYTGQTKIDGSYIKVASLNSADTPVLKIFNYYGNTDDLDSSEIWWDGYKENDKYFLKKGINIIKIEQPCELRIYPDKKFLEAIVFSDLDIVKNTNMINNDLINYQYPVKELFKPVSSELTPDKSKIYLCYPRGSINPVYERKTNLISFDSQYNWFVLDDSEVTNAEKLLLSDLRHVDRCNQFYYNCPLDNSNALDLNTQTLLEKEATKETLANPLTWYDSNNMNNKFVISEIDAEYLNDSGIQIARTSKK